MARTPTIPKMLESLVLSALVLGVFEVLLLLGVVVGAVLLSLPVSPLLEEESLPRSQHSVPSLVQTEHGVLVGFATNVLPQKTASPLLPVLSPHVCFGAMLQFKPVKPLEHVQVHVALFVPEYVPEGEPLFPQDCPFAPVVHDNGDAIGVKGEDSVLAVLIPTELMADTLKV